MPASVSFFFFFFLQAQALFLVRDEWTKFEYVMKIMHRAPFEVLNFKRPFDTFVGEGFIRSWKKNSFRTRVRGEVFLSSTDGV